jgi:hypothetical protein
MTRSSNPQRAKRINTAVLLMDKEKSTAKVAMALAVQYGISKRQAYRYVQEAEVIGKEIPVPDTKIAFTVKLSRNLVQTLRRHAMSTGQNLSDIVAQALDAFLQDGRRRG